MTPNRWLGLVLVGAVIGLVFAGLSTYDFVQHLDRQVHSLHCSFIPGMGTETGESGCQVAMMSQYSSVFRSRVWGGIPISLPAMAVFAVIALFAIDLLVTRRKHDRRATAFLALATGVPALASLTMLVIALSKLGTTCKLCIGIYIASAACLLGALGLWRHARRLHAAGGVPIARSRAPRPDPAEIDRRDDPAWTGAKELEPPERDARPTRPGPRLLAVEVDAPAASNQLLAAAFGVGVLFVVVPVVLYLALAPDHGRFVGTCDSLVKPEDTYGVMVKVGPSRLTGRAARAIEVLDPLCPACAAFEDRLSASGFDLELDRWAIMFPLDKTCNWMVTDTTHPGACTVSEAVLCAQAATKGEVSGAPAVIAWAFANGERIRNETKADPGAAARLVKEKFPELASCIGSPEAKSRLNKSLRWAVANNLRVLTPQLFVETVKLCDEDVDLGLEYTLNIMLERHRTHTLALQPAEAMPVAPGSAAAPDLERAPKPKADRPAADKPVTDKPVTDKPGMDKPGVDKPVADKPVADKPVADKPPAPENADNSRPAAPPPLPPEAKPVTSPAASEPTGGPP